MKRKPHYFDHASTTPLDKRVFSAMLPFLGLEFGNPSNLYQLGRNAKQAVFESTTKIASILGCYPDEFIFTSGATEADNLAIQGIARANDLRLQRSDLCKRKGVTSTSAGRIIISSLEHKGIMTVCEVLKKEGFDIVILPVKKNGLVDLEALKNSLNDQTILVSITYADSETGTIQPIKEVAKIISDFRKRAETASGEIPRHSTQPRGIGFAHDTPFFKGGIRATSTDSFPVNMVSAHTARIPPLKKGVPRASCVATSRGAGDLSSINQQLTPNSQLLTPNLPYLHTDATQASSYLDINVNKLGVDLLTISAHKLNGPKGIGGLFVRRGLNIKPLIYGGGQQSRLRSGTENVPGIVGFAKALELNARNKKSSSLKVAKMCDALEKGIFKSIPKVVLNGHPQKRLPNFLNISILDIEGEAILLHLDELGIMVNTGSACNSQSLEPSAVLMALNNPYEYIHGSIRFTLGSTNTMSDVRFVLKHLPPIVKRLRAISPLELKLDSGRSDLQNAIGRSDLPEMKKAFIGGQTPHFLRRRKL